MKRAGRNNSITQHYKMKFNKRLWEELIAYNPFIVISVSDIASRKKTSVYMCIEVNKTVELGRLQCWHY
jgi:hypothetical protein